MPLLTSSRTAFSPAAAVAEGGSALRRLEFRALGTHCQVQYVPAAVGAVDFERAAVDWVARFEARYSRFRPDSIVSRVNLAAGVSWADVDAETEELLDVCDALYRMSGGILDVTAGPLVRLWDYRLPRHELPDDAGVEAARNLVGWTKVERSPGRIFLPRAGMSLDFGGWGKEWAVDAVAQLAVEHGIRQAMVDFGHDIRCVGTPPGRPAWHVGLENPDEPGAYQGSVGLAAGQGIASSGDYLRGFVHQGRRYGHIVDPRTGRPVAHGARQVTVVAPTCFQAGLLSTVAFVLGPESGREFVQRFPGADARFVSAQGRAETRGFWNHVVT